MLAGGRRPKTEVREEVLQRLRVYIDAALHEQELILERAYWFRNKCNNSGLLEPFGLQGVAVPEQFAALEEIRALNSEAHEGSRTQGAAGLLQLVADSQGGRYCRMCGEKGSLHVDHIRPASRGGTEHLSNLQLLCGRCNLGKGATQFGNLPSVLRVTASQAISDGLRFLRLSLRSFESDGRPLGRCDSGHFADESVLSVYCPEALAANLTNLLVTCEVCR